MEEILTEDKVNLFCDNYMKAYKAGKDTAAFVQARARVDHVFAGVNGEDLNWAEFTKAAVDYFREKYCPVGKGNQELDRKFQNDLKAYVDIKKQASTVTEGFSHKYWDY